MISAGRRAGRWRWALGGALVAVALLVLGGALLAWQTALVLRAGLWLTGHDEVTFDELGVGVRELELTGLRIGDPPAQRLAELRIRYRPQMLLRWQVEEIAARGLVLHGELDEHGLRLRGLEGTGATADGEPLRPPLPMPERISVQDARLELSTPFGALSVPFAGELRPDQGRTAFVLEVESAQLAGAAERLFADFRLEGEMPSGAERLAADPRQIAADLTASARVDLRAEALSLPDLAEGIDGRAELAFVWERGELDATLRSLRLELAALAPGWSALAAVLPAPWLVELRQPAGISASLRADESRVEGHGSIALASAGPRLNAAASAALSLGPDGGLREVVVPDGEIELRDLLVGGMRLDRGSIRGDGAGTPESWQGDLELELIGAGEPAPGLRLEGISARAGLDARFAEGRLSLSVSKPGALRLEQLSTEQARVDGLELRLEASAVPFVSADFRDGGSAWQQRLAAQVPAFEAAILVDPAPVRLAGEIQQLKVELMGQGAALVAGRIALAGGALRSPSHQLGVAGIASEIALSAAGLSPDQTIPVAIGSIVHQGKPAWFAPLRLEGSVQPQGDRIPFDVGIARQAGGVEARMVGAHDLASGQGQARLDVPPIDFAPGQLQPVGLAPVLADLVADVVGRLAMAGTLRWGAGAGVAADVDVLVENLAFTSGPARFQEVNGVIAFDRLVPPSTPPGQQLAVGLIDIGLPLTNGLLTFDLEPDHLAVEQVRWQFAEGRIQAAPFTIGSADMRFATTLSAERLKLDEIFALTQLDGLSGEGTMHGTLPITVAGADAIIEDGELVSDRPGWVRYRPDQAPAAFEAAGENVNLLLQALENFRYEELRLTIDGRTDAEMDVGLHLAGANPDLYDGYPIEFNLNLEGALANVLRSGLAGYQIPERIRERMQGFGR
ncbi:MAG: intermembrane phospholipid transport protein YdbH family protein [Geminicoccaceae bacterium]